MLCRDDTSLLVLKLSRRENWMKFSRADIFTFWSGSLRENTSFISFLFLYVIRILTNFVSHNFDCLYFRVKTESYYIVWKQAANLRTKYIILRTLYFTEIGSVNSDKWCDIPIMSLLNAVGLIMLKLFTISRATKCKLDVFGSG